LPLPPADELCIFLSYKNKEVVAYTENAKKVEFYVDGHLFYVDNDPPFKIRIDEGHLVKGVAYGKNSYVWDEIFI